MSHRPDSRSRRPNAVRLAGLAALVGALAALGCTKSPLAWTLDFAPPLAVAGKPAGPNVTTPTSTPTPRATATAFPTIGTETAPPASVAPSVAATLPPTAPPSVSAIAPTDPLPVASTDSDLAPAEQLAVEQLLSSEDVLAFLPAELIHDGGVVLFRTLAVDEPRRAIEPVPLKPMGPPPPWVRAEDGRSGPQLVLRRDCPDGSACTDPQAPVRATVRYQEKGIFSYRNETGLVEKKYGALFSRVMLLKPLDGKYTLDQVSPISVTTSGGRASLEIAQVSFFGKALSPLAVLRDEAATTPVARQPRVVGGDRARLEVDLVNRELNKAFVFLSRPGAGPTARVQLLDDGKGVDRVAGDGRFSGEFVVPNKPGVQHAVIDVIDPRSFLPNNPFRSNSLGLSYQVDVREK